MCKAARLFIMECEDSREDEDLRDREAPMIMEGESSRINFGPEIVEVELGISILHAFMDSPSPKTIRLVGKIQGCRVVILILIQGALTTSWIHPLSRELDCKHYQRKD